MLPGASHLNKAVWIYNNRDFQGLWQTTEFMAMGENLHQEENSSPLLSDLPAR